MIKVTLLIKSAKTEKDKKYKFINNHKIFWNKNLHQINLWVNHEKSRNKNLHHKLPKTMKMYKTKNVSKLKFSKLKISNLKLKILKFKILKFKISKLKI